MNLINLRNCKIIVIILFFLLKISYSQVINNEKSTIKSTKEDTFKNSVLINWGHSPNYIVGGNSSKIQYFTFQRNKNKFQSNYIFGYIKEKDYTREKGAEAIYFSSRFYWDKKYYGFNLGFMIFNFIAGETPGIIPIPVGGFNLGYMKKMYISFNFLEDKLYHPFSIEMNYLMNKHLIHKIKFGINIFKSELKYNADFDLSLFKHIKIKNSILFTSDEHLGFRIGIGI